MKTISVFYCLLYAMWTEGSSISVTGFERGNVSFQCSHKFAESNNKYFCKDPCEHRTNILVTVKSGKRAESGRITLVDLGNGVFSVTFSQLQLLDSGRYWCAVDRPVFDTFTAVYLTVKKAVVKQITTATPELSVSSSTQLISGITLSAASNCTSGGEQNISTGTVVYTTVGAVVSLTILVIGTCFRKYRKNSKPQPRVCTNSTDLVSADERQADCEYDDFVKEVQLMQKLPCAHRPEQGAPPPASTAAEHNEPHLYENICCGKSTADSRCSAANVQDEPDISSAVYITPLPFAIPEVSRDSSLGKYPNEPTPLRNTTSGPTEICTGNESDCHTRSDSDYSEVRPRSLWFGLDLSGTF